MIELPVPADTAPVQHWQDLPIEQVVQVRGLSFRVGEHKSLNRFPIGELVRR